MRCPMGACRALYCIPVRSVLLRIRHCQPDFRQWERRWLGDGRFRLWRLGTGSGGSGSGGSGTGGSRLWRLGNGLRGQRIRWLGNGLRGQRIGNGLGGSGSSGSGNTGTGTTSNAILYAASFAGSDASGQINGCIAAVIAAGGGTCDARTLGGIQMMSESIQVGNAASVAQGIGLTLLLPDTGVWMWNLTDGTSCGIDQFSGTSVVSQQPAGGGDRMVLAARGGSSMDSIYCTDGGAGEALYVRAEGFAVWNNQSGSSFANGVVHIRGVADQSSFTRIFAENYYGDVWHVDSACCGATFMEIQGTSNGTANFSNGGQGGVPLTLGPGKVDVGLLFQLRVQRTRCRRGGYQDDRRVRCYGGEFL